MLKSFYVKNFKNFRDGLTIDFTNHGDYQFNTDCISNGIISKLIIYGRNAAGKTNLGQALLDAYYTLSGRQRLTDASSYLNADTDNEVAEFCYTMQFGNDEVIYHYTKFSPTILAQEKLTINSNTVFKIDFSKPEYYCDPKFVDLGDVVIQRYIKEMKESDPEDIADDGQVSFFRWLISSIPFPEESPIEQASRFLRRISFLTNQNSRYYPSSFYSRFYESLVRNDKLDDFEDFLNSMGIPCKLAVQQTPDGQYQLYFVHNKLLPFVQAASSGTLALTGLYLRIISNGLRFSILYFDEFDAFFHYEMAERLVRYFKRAYPQIQIILTTHNTNLLTNHLMRPDCYYILSQSGQLTALRDATKRELREGHNLEKMYISGEFEDYE